MNKPDIPTVYSPKEVEEKWYKHWEDNHFFHTEVDPSAKPFCIVMPPPNVTGQLHGGHALDNTLQDILTRFRRMQGYNTLWLPGTDHAGIATQAKVEEQLAQEGTSKHELGREKFLERVWEWKEQYGGRITHQLRRLGASCDWDRERFTMDEGCSAAVREVFVRLYEKGLIYRGNYITNWCPKCHTTISDIEVEHLDKPGHLYHLKYPAKDSADYLVVATTRPETMLGDVAVAVHPEDERYKHLIGKTVILPLVGREMPVIADEYVDPAFGTGALKITPAHDPNDFEVARRHNLPSVQVIDKQGAMNETAGKYRGLDRWECRKRLVKDLDAMGYLIKIDDHDHAVGHCYRCSTVIEPMLSKQWFVHMKPLAEPAIKAAVDGSVRFIPERFSKTYLNWMENIRDWCISRQLWWGHRIPVWYCQDCEEVVASKATVTVCPKCGSSKLEQDPDVLDTWFSSALWPFSTLGWPSDTPELKHFYPTSVLVTGRDIIFFWVARMIFSGLAFMEEVPFKEVFIHGLVLDAMGRKMSKSLGNGIDPIDLIESHGADSLRFMLVTGNTPGNDLRFHFERLDGARNFANKLWNASRFSLMNLTDYNPKTFVERQDYTLADRWVLSRYQATIRSVTKNLEAYELGEAARSLYEFIWGEFCDWYLELVKPRVYGKEGENARIIAQQVLASVLQGTLEMLHPFMPFITEEIWQHLPHEGQTVMHAAWPVYNEALTDSDAEKRMEVLMEVTKEIRRIRSEMNVLPSKQVDAVLLAEDNVVREILKDGISYIQNLSRCKAQIVSQLEGDLGEAVHAVTHGVEVYVPLKGLIDTEKEIARLEKELKTVRQDLSKVQGKLSNSGYLAKAPAEVIEKDRGKEAELSAKEKALIERIAVLK